MSAAIIVQLPVVFEFRQSAREANLAAESPKASIGVRCGEKLKASANGLGDARAASALRFLQEFGRDFDGDLTVCSHNSKLYHIEDQH